MVGNLIEGVKSHSSWEEVESNTSQVILWSILQLLITIWRFSKMPCSYRANPSNKRLVELVLIAGLLFIALITVLQEK